MAAALLLVNVGAASAPQKTPRQTASDHESFDELYQRGQRANAAIKTLTARFTETTTSSLVTRPLVAHGTLVVERPSRVVMRYTEPEARTILIDGSRMITSWPGRNIRQVTDIGAAQGRVQKYFVNGSAAQLRGQFDIQEHDSSNGRGRSTSRWCPNGNRFARRWRPWTCESIGRRYCFPACG